MALVARVAGFALATELAVFAVARVERVARFGFSASLSTGSSSSSTSSVTVSVFFGRPFVFAAVVFAVDFVTFLSSTSVFVLLVARTVCFGSSVVGFSFSRDVTFTLLLGAAASGAGAGAEAAVALVRGAMFDC